MDLNLNQSFEHILIDHLNLDIEPITRLAAYLCLRYKVQALIDIGWRSSARPIGFFDLLRNIRVITNEDDFQGIITMTMRIRPSTFDKKFTLSNPSPSIEDIPFDQIGAFWFIEFVLINIQNEQRTILSSKTYENDFSHPLINSFKRIGLEYTDSEYGDFEFRPVKTPVTVDEVIKAFITEKPGAKSSSITVWNSDELK